MDSSASDDDNFEDFDSDEPLDNVGSYKARKPEASPVVNKLDGDDRNADDSQELEADRRSPRRTLQIVDLPEVIIRLILDRLASANDLSNAALTCSTLHAVAVELIYSRFDIVWPENYLETDDGRTGVDALTYGLSTLAMSEPAPDPPEHIQSTPQRDKNQENETEMAHGKQLDEVTVKRRPRYIGNSYARYVRDFSIGNGPPDSIKKYTVDTDAGKMLNTLVAITLRRARGLQSFKWDMPTGITRDVWLALASLADERDGHECVLRHFWLRIYDRRLPQYQPPRPASPDSAPAEPEEPEFQLSRIPRPQPYFQQPNAPTTPLNAPFPAKTFSLLPPLQSLTVMDIDVPQYLYEMSDLIDRSRSCLRQLRISCADNLNAKYREWRDVWEGDDVPDPHVQYGFPSTTSQKRAGGVLGTLFGRFLSPVEYASALDHIEEMSATPDAPDSGERLAKLNMGMRSLRVVAQRGHQSAHQNAHQYQILSQKLSLDSLECSTFPLSWPVLVGVLDWTKLTSLTLLECAVSDNLWTQIRRQYTPQSHSECIDHAASCYALRLRDIRMDCASPHFVRLLGETLAPHSLRRLILTERYTPARPKASIVGLRQLFKEAIKRHGHSLEVLAIDSAYKKPSGRIDASKLTTGHYHMQWLAHHSVLTYITSGSMKKLRELSICVKYEDWHYFLRRLSHVPSLQALYVPVLHVDRVVGAPRKLLPEEAAWQVCNVVYFRPEISLKYFATTNTCYQIYETDKSQSNILNDDTEIVEVIEEADPVDANAQEVVAVEDSDGPDSDDDGDSGTDSDAESDSSEGGWGSEEEGDKDRVNFYPGEILFPNDKIEIFKARRRRL